MSPLRSFLVGSAIGFSLLIAGGLYIVIRTPTQEKEAEALLEHLHRSVRQTIRDSALDLPATPGDIEAERTAFFTVQRALLDRYPDLWERLADPKAIYGFGEKITQRIDLMGGAMNTLTHLLAREGLSIGGHAALLSHLVTSPPPSMPADLHRDLLRLIRFYCSYYKVAGLSLPQDHPCRSPRGVSQAAPTGADPSAVSPPRLESNGGSSKK
ncbi:MAG: hypothetical protein D6795_02960 [Deltaproteobacteria bacterium]|nr:MAG: hypothetical protein D6795_02960 [Deltaproteobacteria bacterium]